MTDPEHASLPLHLPPTRRAGLQRRVADAIVEAAASVMAARGSQASMADVAAEAGLARATVYRYFSNRAALIAELGRVAAAEVGERFSSARLNEVPAREAIVRAVRALLDGGDALVALARERVRPEGEEFERLVGVPLRQVVERGQSAGELRDDIPPAWLADYLLALVVSALASRPSLGREDVVAAISSVYLDGSHTRPSAV